MEVETLLAQAFDTILTKEQTLVPWVLYAETILQLGILGLQGVLHDTYGTFVGSFGCIHEGHLLAWVKRALFLDVIAHI